jgi:hypothetical protein
MSRVATLLAVLTDTPTSTSDLYDKVGYISLVREGLVPYEAFRRALAELVATGAVESFTAADGSTLWRLADRRVPAGPEARRDG